MNTVRLISNRLCWRMSTSGLMRYSSGADQLGEPGNGAGKGGGGAIRNPRGVFGERQAGKEDEYFYKKEKEQLTVLKEDLDDEISSDEDEIERHQEAIERHKKRIDDMDDED